MPEELFPSPRCAAMQRASKGEVLQMERAQVKLYGIFTRQERPETVGGAAIKRGVKFLPGKAPAGSFGLHVQFGQKRVMRGEKGAGSTAFVRGVALMDIGVRGALGPL